VILCVSPAIDVTFQVDRMVPELRAPTAGEVDPAHYVDELAGVSVRALDVVG
jgi:hypothetical protein